MLRCIHKRQGLTREVTVVVPLVSVACCGKGAIPVAGGVEQRLLHASHPCLWPRRVEGHHHLRIWVSVHELAVGIRVRSVGYSGCESVLLQHINGLLQQAGAQLSAISNGPVLPEVAKSLVLFLTRSSDVPQPIECSPQALRACARSSRTNDSDATDIGFLRATVGRSAVLCPRVDLEERCHLRIRPVLSYALRAQTFAALDVARDSRTRLANKGTPTCEDGTEHVQFGVEQHEVDFQC
mmetsp:Transcript_60696/g.141437  ORF Transcript_60696/g.141437 Transcript_60696/m.141437 type:complete len:239 (+) Transcript_60696:255-971(+)